jgi:uncharacterized protein (TIGR03086 family)
MPDDLRPLHRTALDDAGTLVGQIAAADLARPTPCAAWNLADLLAHMIGQHHGFAAAVRAGTASPAAYAPRPYTPVRWTESVRAVCDAFAAADLDGATVLVEIAPGALPLRRVVGAQLLDTVVHTWDVARALGRDHVPAADLVAVVAAVAAAVPDGELRDRPGAAFARSVPGRSVPGRSVSAPGTAWDRALARLGCDPGRPGPDAS